MNVPCFLFVFIQMSKPAGKESSGNGMPYAGNGTDDGRFRRGSKLGCCGGKVGCQSGILHTDFDGNGTFLCNIHSGKTTCTITQQIAQTIMKKNCCKDYYS